MGIVILKPMTKAEQAVSNAHQTLQHVDQEQINDPVLLRKLVVGFQKMGNRILFKE